MTSIASMCRQWQIRIVHQMDQYQSNPDADDETPDARRRRSRESMPLFVAAQVIACPLEALFILAMTSARNPPAVGMALICSSVAVLFALPISVLSAPASKKRLGQALLLWHTLFLIAVVLIIIYAATRPQGYGGPGGF